MADQQQTLATVQSALDEFLDPETGRSVVEMQQVRDLRLEGAKLSLTLALSTHSAILWEETRRDLRVLLQARAPGL